MTSFVRGWVEGRCEFTVFITSALLLFHETSSPFSAGSDGSRVARLADKASDETYTAG
jgi:hypothetical protein